MTYRNQLLLEMQRELNALCARWEAQDRRGFRMGTGILVSEATQEATRPLFRWSSLGEIQIKGRAQAVHVYGVAALT
jgi:class 3 adenylate cyclase